MSNKQIILVVEDDIPTQQLMMFYLRSEYKTCFATTIEESIEQIEKNEVKIVTLDISLRDGQNGLDFCRFLRKSSKWKDMPIIAVTAHAFPHHRQECLAAGCNDYLAKPIKQQELLELIKLHVKG